ncbi:MAG: TonB family protein [Caulobacteraceae bacterium]
MFLAIVAAAALSTSAAGYTQPAFVRKPSFGDVEAMRPPQALEKSLSGSATMDCLVSVKGALDKCQVVTESPPDVGFGAAALALAPEFVLKPATAANKPVRSEVQFTITFPAHERPRSPPSVGSPDWLRKPTPAQLEAVWPTQAQRAGVSGVAVLECEANIHGLLEKCRVVAQSPPGMDFGAAALLLTPQFQFRPATGPNGPVTARVTIPMRFIGAGEKDIGPRDHFGEATMIFRPYWLAAPGFADVARAYPAGGGGRVGHVTLRCHVKGDGGLNECKTAEENPQGAGFGAAARSLIGGFRLSVGDALARNGEPKFVVVPITLIDPKSAEFLARRIGAPSWSIGLDPDQAVRLFPPAAADKGLRTGRGVASCVVAPNGALTGCRPLTGDPPDLGFSEAAVRIASVMKINPWTDEGGPVDGATVRLPIRFNLSGGQHRAAAKSAAR